MMRVNGESGDGAGAITRGAVAQAFTTELALTTSDGWVSLPASGGTSTTIDGELRCTIPSSVTSTGHAGAYLGSGFPRSSTWSAILRLHARNVNVSTWERAILRIGDSADDCAAVILTGYGSLDLGYFDGGAWSGVVGRGANADVRTPYAAGELVMAVRRTPLGTSVELYSGADVDTALSSEPFACIASGDTALLRKGRGGQFVQFELQTSGPLGLDADVAVVEAAIEVGGAT